MAGDVAHGEPGESHVHGVLGLLVALELQPMQQDYGRASVSAGDGGRGGGMDYPAVADDDAGGDGVDGVDLGVARCWCWLLDLEMSCRTWCVA